MPTEKIYDLCITDQEGKIILEEKSVYIRPKGSSGNISRGIVCDLTLNYGSIIPNSALAYIT
jgi:hypothetical protein